MKLFNWVHRKFRQNPNQDTKQFSVDPDPSSHESNVDPPPHEWCSRLKNTRKERSTTAMKVATASVKPPETRSKQAVEQYFHEIDPAKLGQKDVVGDLQHGLLTIGTLGINELIVEEEMNEMETSSVRADSEVSPMEVQEFQEELERVFYTKDEEGRRGKQWQNKFVEIEDEKAKPEKTHDDECEGKLQEAGKKVFPLHEFLEIPLELPVVKKKQVLIQGLSNLFSCAGPQKALHNSNDCNLAQAKGNAKRIRISPFFLNKLLRMGRETDPGHAHSSSRLAKLLQLFRKKTISQSAKDHKHRKIGDGGKNSKVRSDKSGETYATDDTEEHDNFCNRLEAFGYQNCSSDESCIAADQERRWLHQDDLWELNNCNEYWIKTDDEYVVLEL